MRSGAPTARAEHDERRWVSSFDRRPAPARVRVADRRRSVCTTTPQEAAVFDSVVVPRGSALFGRPRVARVTQGLRGQALDVGCGTEQAATRSGVVEARKPL
jgi:16S rRNA G1207 methylase RsmC